MIKNLKNIWVKIEVKIVIKKNKKVKIVKLIFKKIMIKLIINSIN